VPSGEMSDLCAGGASYWADHYIATQCDRDDSADSDRDDSTDSDRDIDRDKYANRDKHIHADKHADRACNNTNAIRRMSKY
jgi:hypothetical protein